LSCEVSDSVIHYFVRFLVEVQHTHDNQQSENSVLIVVIVGIICRNYSLYIITLQNMACF